ncbi:MAG: hypothetical protein NC922_04540 [Candidatus Omnitrophica bacterium]|nr:hypothetical protein [Candidatus Omnitrophota bacterium]
MKIVRKNLKINDKKIIQKNNLQNSRSNADYFLLELFKIIITVSGISLTLCLSLMPSFLIKKKLIKISMVLLFISIISSVIGIGELQGLVYKHEWEISSKKDLVKKPLMGSMKGLEMSGWISYVCFLFGMFLIFISILLL